eukprot:359315-Chlamydomonas_euryale.AAC.2
MAPPTRHPAKKMPPPPRPSLARTCGTSFSTASSLSALSFIPARGSTLSAMPATHVAMASYRSAPRYGTTTGSKPDCPSCSVGRTVMKSSAGGLDAPTCASSSRAPGSDIRTKPNVNDVRKFAASAR